VLHLLLCKLSSKALDPQLMEFLHVDEVHLILILLLLLPLK
jgi:hypothetical protein